MKEFFTSESVTEGHPDKVCDQVSDAILDAILEQDPKGRVAVESFATNGVMFIAGEITTSAYVDIPKIARDVIKDIGYINPDYGFHYKNCGVMTAIQEQSSNIAEGVRVGEKEELEKLGAGDQGCIKKGSLVRTKKGFVPIENVRKGNLVATPYGFKKVLEAKKTGRRKVVGVSFSNGMFLECTPEHKILCFNKIGDTYWKSAADLKQGDFVTVLKPQKNFARRFLTSSVNKTQFFTKHNHKIYGPARLICDEGVGYMQGELVGDGYVASNRLLEIAFGKNLQHAKATYSLADIQMPKQWRLLGEGSNGSSLSLKIDSLVVRKHFENFGVKHNKAPQKVTPDSVFASPRNVIIAYLRGLFDSDGTIVSKAGRNGKNIRVRLGSTSLQLLRETQLLLNDLGIKSSILFNTSKGSKVGRLGRHGKRYRSKYDSYALSLVGFESYFKFCTEIGFLNKQKQARVTAYLKSCSNNKPQNSRGLFLVPHPKKDEMVDEKKLGASYPFSVCTVKNVQDIDAKEDVYDLEVEDVNMFSANGVFVHNSMFGYATDETKELMPLPITLAHRLAKRLAEVRKRKILPYIRPDGKSQVTVEYEDGMPKRIENVVISTQQDPDISLAKLSRDIKEKVINAVVPKELLDKKTNYFINPAGKFVIGGPQADTGLTGRKIIVDTYGGVGSHGGGALSGKDPSKVDRTGSYAARYVAKNIVAAKLAQKCEVRVAYAIGVTEPLMVRVNTYGTGKLPDDKLSEIVSKVFDLRPGMIIKNLDLRRPIYRKVAAYGHFGREELKVPWERTDKAGELKAVVKK